LQTVYLSRRDATVWANLCTTSNDVWNVNNYRKRRAQRDQRFTQSATENADYCLHD
jgi:hypothetical protein